MNDQEIIKNNKLIAEFMGGIPCCTGGELLQHKDKSNCVWIPGTVYHESWDWLMLIVEKIEDRNVSLEIAYIQDFGANICTMLSYNPDSAISITEVGASKIETVYKAVVSFIKEYNEEQNGK